MRKSRPASARDTELGIIVQDGGTEEGTGIETLNFGTNLGSCGGIGRGHDHRAGRRRRRRVVV